MTKGRQHIPQGPHVGEPWRRGSILFTAYYSVHYKNAALHSTQAGSHKSIRTQRSTTHGKCKKTVCAKLHTHTHTHTYTHKHTHTHTNTHTHRKQVLQAWQYRGADKSLARPTSRCILFDRQNISFVASLVTYINSTNIPPIMSKNKIYETQNLLSLQLVSFLVEFKDLRYRTLPHSPNSLLLQMTKLNLM